MRRELTCSGMGCTFLPVFGACFLYLGAYFKLVGPCSQEGALPGDATAVFSRVIGFAIEREKETEQGEKVSSPGRAALLRVAQPTEHKKGKRRVESFWVDMEGSVCGYYARCAVYHAISGDVLLCLDSSSSADSVASTQ